MGACHFFFRPHDSEVGRLPDGTTPFRRTPSGTQLPYVRCLVCSIESNMWGRWALTAALQLNREPRHLPVKYLDCVAECPLPNEIVPTPRVKIFRNRLCKMSPTSFFELGGLNSSCLGGSMIPRQSSAAERIKDQARPKPALDRSATHRPCALPVAVADPLSAFVWAFECKQVGRRLGAAFPATCSLRLVDHVTSRCSTSSQ